MQTSDIQNIISRFPIIKERFIGVFPIDLIPKSLAPKSALIFNRDTSEMNGSHWICLVRGFENDYQIFDSLSTKFDEIYPYFKFRKAVYYFNSNAFQESNSNTCGLFSCYFLIHRLMNLEVSYNELLSEIFVENKSENEKEVLDFFSYFA